MRTLSFKDKLTSFLLRNLLRLLSATWRYHEEIDGESQSIVRGEEPGVIAFLHGKMLPIWYRFRGGEFAALVSTSRDGQLLVDYLEGSLHYNHVVRGSSSRGGRAAFSSMVHLLRDQGRTLLITPDGPRGPAGIPKRGSLLAARIGERRVVVVTWSAGRVVRLKSWDAMEIPYPFTTIKCRYCIVQITPQSETKNPTNKESDEKLLATFQQMLNNESS